MKITIVAGARPNFIKIAPLIREINRRPELGIEFRLVHTGQHYDEKLSGVFFNELQIPLPHANLLVGSGSQAEQTGRIMIEFEKDLMNNPTDIVIVVGDVNSTMACAIVAKKLQVKVVHIEAGIRSFDYTMPEEVNRVVTDALADYFFTTSSFANENLLKQGVDPARIFFVGNIMIDTLLWARNKIKRPSVFDQFSLEKKDYFVITLHRPSNVDNISRMKEILSAIEIGIGDSYGIFPVHPRTAKNLEQLNLKTDKIVLIDPLSYFEFIYLIEHATAVITDSGGVQEETTVLNVPCITLRPNTERPETITVGTNELVGDDLQKLSESLKKVKSGTLKKGSVPDLWDGKTAERIVDVLSSL
ncbi:UDP-N-acetylglucosamine 2-epimerase (non-hydrolyzing) [Candidatus Parcubacteria bacterium]|nr:UDP-N-acetylglucosamine 2-epimerase (non-hydrolyzing) [Candidatus Parcubacteria bacterium]